jgi:glycosyltransferase involved in cell wall biosynthesis
MLLNDKLSAHIEPQISVVIATLREDTAFLATVDSCLAQKGVDLEVISFIHDPTHEMSSPAFQCDRINGKRVIKLRANDGGIADAWNAAVLSASGRLVVFLGAGDVFFSSSSIERLLKAGFEKLSEDKEIVLIGTQFIRKDDKRLQHWIPCGDPARDGLLRGMAIPHASSFWPRSLWKTDQFDTKFKIALDYEYAIRVRKKIKYVVIPVPVAIIEPGGLSNAPSRMIQVILEDVRARQKNSLPAMYVTTINFKRLVRWIIKKFA